MKDYDPSAEGWMLIEFYRRGQRVFCTVANWRLAGISSAGGRLSQGLFSGTIA